MLELPSGQPKLATKLTTVVGTASYDMEVGRCVNSAHLGARLLDTDYADVMHGAQPLDGLRSERFLQD